MSRSTRNLLTARLRQPLAARPLEDRTAPALLTVTSAADSGPGSLREAIGIADANGEDDTIQFSGVTAINLTTGQLSLTGENKVLTIDGPGVTISGAATASATNRIFNFNVAGGNPTVTLNGLTLTGGNLTSGNSGAAILVHDDPLLLLGVTFTGNKTASAGGAIATTSAVAANITVIGSTFTGNSASTGGAINGTSSIQLNVIDSTFGSNTTTSNGGAMHFAGGASTVTINQSKFTDNIASSNGGGISNSATTTFTITASTFTGNQGPAGGAFRFAGTPTVSIDATTVSGNLSKTGVGGGIYFVGAGTLNLTNSTVSGNTATTAGGGLSTASATVTITNSTISGNTANSATLGGGGISLSTGVLTVNNSTLTGNIAAGASSSGGGIRKTSATGTLTLNSTIVAANTAATGGQDLHATSAITVAGGDNLIGVADVGAFTLSGTNKTGTAASPLDPLLEPLADNGGPTPTHKLLDGSPAVNAGNNNLGLNFDQRGTGFPRVQGAAADIGAFEGFSVIPSAVGVLPNVPPVEATYTATVIYADETGINTGTIDVNDVKLGGPGFGSPVSPTTAGFSGTGTSVTATYTFTPPGGSWDFADNGKYTLEMQADQVFDTDATPNPVTAGPVGSFTVGLPLPPQVVDNVGDTDDGNYGPGELTLREAINRANGSVGAAESISFSASLNGQSIALGSVLTITDPVVITGPGADKLTVTGSGATRLFDISIPAVGASVEVTGLTLTGGNATTGTGGAIVLVDEALTLAGVEMTANSITGTGGAIGATGAATLTVGDSTFTNNTSTSAGGAINTSGNASVTVNNSTFSGNQAGSSGGAINATTTVTLNVADSTFSGNQGTLGGAIRTTNTTSTITINRSTLTGNTATTSNGGGAYFSGGTLTVESSAVWNNIAAVSGGGIGMTSTTATFTNTTVSGNIGNGTGTLGGGGLSVTTGVLTVNNSTIANNSAPGGSGGGIRKTSTTGAVTFNSTILAANTSANGGAAFHLTVAGSVTIAGDNNLIGVADVGNFTLTGANLTGTAASPLDPLLNGLTDNGGPTLSQSLQPGSPAVNAGNNVLGLSFDQRGTGFPRVLGAAADIGAFEGVSVAPGAKATLPNVPPADPTYSATVIYFDETGINTGSIDVNDVKLGGPGYGSPVSPTTANFTGGGTSVTATYTFTPPGGSWDFNDNGKYTLEMQANQVFDTDAAPNSVPAGPIGSFTVGFPLPPQVVDNAGDTDDGNYGPGELTLREAINRANAAVGTAESISFSPSLNGQTITLGSELKITDSVDIAGPGAAKLTVSGGGTVRLFTIDSPTAGAAVTIAGLTLVNGSANTGAAIQFTDETVSVTAVVFDGHVNTSTGGAIFWSGKGFLSVDSSTFTNNSSTAGGAITSGSASGDMLISNSTFVNNKTTLGNAGGAVRVNGPSGTLGVVIRNSTFVGNVSGFNGGGVGFGNTFSGTALITNSTFTQNEAQSTGGGGGIGVNTASTGSVVIESSIVFGNIASGTGTGPDLFGTDPITANFSLIGSSAGASVFTPDATTSALLGQDPLLDGLADNGGPTQTIALKAGSPALDQGSNPQSLAFDQRGTGFDRKSGPGVDIGAFEVQSAAAPITAKVQTDDGSAQRSVVRGFTVTFSETPSFPNGIAAAFQLQRTGPAAGFASGLPTGTVTGVTATPSGTVVTLTFTDPTFSEGKGSLIDGNYTLTLVADNITGVGGKLDGNGDGTGGDNQVITTFRLFGDGNGDRDTDFNDFLAFRSAFGSTGPSPPYDRAFDFDDDNAVNFNDFLAFRSRFGATLATP